MLKRQRTKVFDISGKPMKGWAMVSIEGHRTSEQLSAWVERGLAVAASLPPK